MLHPTVQWLASGSEECRLQCVVRHIKPGCHGGHSDYGMILLVIVLAEG
jgi:hypothetical protein